MSSIWSGRSRSSTPSNRLAGRTIYSIEVVTNADRLTIEGEGGVLSFNAQRHFGTVEGVCDSVLLVCGLSTRSVCDPALSAWLRKMATKVRRLGSMCVSSFLLAAAGLLNGRRATTHWKFGRELATRYPEVRVEHDPVVRWMLAVRDFRQQAGEIPQVLRPGRLDVSKTRGFPLFVGRADWPGSCPEKTRGATCFAPLLLQSC